MDECFYSEASVIPQCTTTTENMAFRGSPMRLHYTQWVQMIVRYYINSFRINILTSLCIMCFEIATQGAKS